MSTLHLSDSLLNDFVAIFTQLGQQDQAILLSKLTESMKSEVAVTEDTRSADEMIDDLQPSQTRNRNFRYERIADPTGVEEARQIFGAWSGSNNHDDVEQILRAIAENRTLEREVTL